MHVENEAIFCEMNSIFKCTKKSVNTETINNEKMLPFAFIIDLPKLYFMK